MADRCLKCGAKLQKSSRKNMVCPKCFIDRLEEIVWVTCPNCGREFQSAETTYDGLIDSCRYCGNGQIDEIQS